MATRKLKIAVWHNLRSGGAKRALYEQVKGLTLRGHHIEVWSPSTADMSYLPMGEFAEEHVLPFEWQPPGQAGRIENIMYSYRSIASKMAAMERHCQACVKEIEAGEFDVLFVNPCIFFRASPLGRMLKNTPSIYYLQEPFRWLYEALPNLPWLALPDSGTSPYALKNLKLFLRDLVTVQGFRLQAREERENTGGYDKILVNSLYSRESVLRSFGLDSTVCYLGVDGVLFHPNGAIREDFVVGLGSLTREKGVDVAIRAIAAIPVGKRPELKWIGNVADDNYHRMMVELAVELDVRFEVKINLSDSELIDLLSRAALLLYTSKLEPFGFSPLEANACETPVVAIAEGGVRETVHHMENGLLVNERDPEAIGKAVLKLLEDQQLAHRLGVSGRRMVEQRWIWVESVAQLEEQLEKVIVNRTKRQMGLKQ